MANMVFTIKISDMELWERMQSIILDTLNDKRISQDVRVEYLERYMQATEPKEK